MEILLVVSLEQKSSGAHGRQEFEDAEQVRLLVFQRGELIEFRFGARCISDFVIGDGLASSGGRQEGQGFVQAGGSRAESSLQFLLRPNDCRAQKP
jgi:hypothetical protein